MLHAKDHELILWDGVLYRRVDDDERAAERAQRHLHKSDLVATEEILHEGRVISEGEVIPPPALHQGFPFSIDVYLPTASDAHDRLVESGQARRVQRVD
jgi:hypothetical protein